MNRKTDVHTLNMRQKAVTTKKQGIHKIYLRKLHKNVSLFKDFLANLYFNILQKPLSEVSIRRQFCYKKQYKTVLSFRILDTL